MNAGDKVYYTKTNRGGYGYTTRYPAVIVAAWPKTGRARIRLAALDPTGQLPVEAVERVVRISHLAPRDSTEDFEALLAG